MEKYVWIYLVLGFETNNITALVIELVILPRLREISLYMMRRQDQMFLVKGTNVHLLMSQCIMLERSIWSPLVFLPQTIYEAHP